MVCVKKKENNHMFTELAVSWSTLKSNKVNGVDDVAIEGLKMNW